MNYRVYDCDSEAKRIMDKSLFIKNKLNEIIHPQAVTDCIIDRKLISEIVFNDNEKLAALNKIVHTAVTDDIISLSSSLKEDTLFIETAILYQSNLDKIVSDVWIVTAPVNVRIERVVKRNNCTPADVLARIKAQDSYQVPHPHPSTFTIVNDNETPVLPQIYNLLDKCVKSPL